MRLSLLLFCLALLTVSQNATAESDSDLTGTADLTMKSDIDRARDGVNALNELIGGFNSRIFDQLGSDTGVSTLLSRILSSVAPLTELIKGSQSETSQVRHLRHQFAQLNTRLDDIALDLQDVHEQMEWQTSLRVYSEHERGIREVNQKYIQYLTAPAAEKTYRQTLFTLAYRVHATSAWQLYRAVIVNAEVVNSRLVDYVNIKTNHYRSRVMNFLLSMIRTILRGAQMQIAYLTIENSVNDGLLAQRDWIDRMRNFITESRTTEIEIKNLMWTLVESEVKSFAEQNENRPNIILAPTLQDILAKKFDWQHWIVCAYLSVPSDKEALIHVNGFVVDHYYKLGSGPFRFRRRIVIGHSDPSASSWSKAKAVNTLTWAEHLNLPSKSVHEWHQLVASKVPADGHQATLALTLCTFLNSNGLEFAVSSPSDRFALSTNIGCSMCTQSLALVVILFG